MKSEKTNAIVIGYQKWGEVHKEDRMETLRQERAHLKSLAERYDQFERFDRRLAYIVLSHPRFKIRDKPDQLSERVRDTCGAKVGVGPEAIRAAIRNEKYDIPGIILAFLEAFWTTRSSIALASELKIRELREAFFGKTEASMRLALQIADCMIAANKTYIESAIGNSIEKSLDQASHFALIGQTNIYRGRIEGAKFFEQAANAWRECHRLSVIAGGNAYALNASNFAAAVNASRAVANLLYSLARGRGIRHPSIKHEAERVIDRVRIGAAYCLGNILRDPRGTLNHSKSPSSPVFAMTQFVSWYSPSVLSPGPSLLRGFGNALLGSCRTSRSCRSFRQ